MAFPFFVCPWWLAPAIDNPVRRLIQNPERILDGYIEAGETVLDLGCGPGFFSIPMAEMVGEAGLVIAVDLQEKMLQMVRKKAVQKGLESRIVTHKSEKDRIGLTDKVDFVLAFYTIHEMRNAEAILREIASILKPRGRLLVVEPIIHVSASSFRKIREAARMAGLIPISEPKIRFSRSMLFQLI